MKYLKIVIKNNIVLKFKLHDKIIQYILTL